MKKPSKKVEKYLKEVRVDSIMDSCKLSVKFWKKRTEKFLKQRGPIFESTVSHAATIELHKDLCYAASSYIYDGNKNVKDMYTARKHLNDARNRLIQMNYQELRDKGLDRLYATEASSYIKECMRKIDELVDSMNRAQMEFISFVLIMLNRASTVDMCTMGVSGYKGYKALTGIDSMRNVSVSWYSNGHDVLSLSSSSTKIVDDDSVQTLIKESKNQAEQISRLTEAVEKLEASDSDKAYYKNLSRALSESEKVPYEKPVVGDSPEEVTGKKPFSVTSDDN